MNEEVNLMAICRECNTDKGKSVTYYRSNEGRQKILHNIQVFVRHLPLIHNFGSWLKSIMKDS